MIQEPDYPNFRWFVLLALIIATAASTVLMIAPAPLIGEISTALAIHPGHATTLMMGTWQIVGATSCLVAGFFVDRFGPAKLMVAGCIIHIVPSLLFPLAGTHVGFLLALRIVQALGMGPINAVLGVLAATWFPVRQRGAVAGLQGMSTSAGVLLGFLIAPATYVHTSNWLATMQWMVVAPIVALIFSCVLLFGPKPPAFQQDEADKPDSASQGIFAEALRSGSTWALIACVFVTCWFFTGVNDLVPGYIAIAPPMGLGYGPVLAGKVMGIYQILFMLGALLVGFIFEKVFRGNVKVTLSVGFLLSAVLICSILLRAVNATAPRLGVVLSIAGFFGAWAIPVVMAFISINYHHSIVGRLTGLAFGIGLYAGVPGIFVGATALKLTGGYHVSIYIVTAVALIGLVICQFLQPARRRNEEKAAHLGSCRES